MGPSKKSKSKKKAARPTNNNLVTPPISPLDPSEWWNDFSKRFHGSSKEPTDSQTFEYMFKMSMTTFDYIISLVKDEITAKPLTFVDLNGKLLNLYDIVAIALRRLSSGESLAAVGGSVNLKQTTVRQITKRFVDALIAKRLRHLYWPSTEDEMEDVKRKFEKLGGLPNCCGAIGTTHILMNLPAAERSTNFWGDREENHSMNVQAIVDADLRFRDIVAGHPGSFTDEMILQDSTFSEKCKEGEILDGKKIELSEGNEVDEYIVGNLGFPLHKWLLTPYRGDNLSDPEVKFNEMLLKTQMVVKKAFAKLKENWKVIQGLMWRPDKQRLPLIILACCILHNVLIDMKDEVQEKLVFSDCHDLDYRPLFCKSDDDPKGLVLRENVSLYLMEDRRHNSSG